MKMHTVPPVRLREQVEGSLNQVALHDFEIFKELFDYDFRKMEEAFGRGLLSMIRTMQETAVTGMCLTSVSVTVSVIWQRAWQKQRRTGLQRENNRIL